MQYLTPMPMSFEEYVMNPQTSNYMLKFLDGRRIYDDNSVMTDTRTDEIIGQIYALESYVGIFEKYALSLSYLDAVGNFQWPDTMEVKRATLNRPNVAQISNSLRSKILEANAQDLRLYNHCLNRLLEKTRQQVVQKIKFKGGRLDFVIPYTMWNCILDVELSDKRFVETNKTFLVTLNHYLHKTVTNGKDYAKQWLKLFNESVAYYYSGSKFLKQLKAIKRPDPLDKIIAIARLIDKAAKDKSLGMDVTEDKLRLRLSKEMAQVLKQDDLTPKGIQKW